MGRNIWLYEPHRRPRPDPRSTKYEVIYGLTLAAYVPGPPSGFDRTDLWPNGSLGNTTT